MLYFAFVVVDDDNVVVDDTGKVTHMFLYLWVIRLAKR